MKRNLFKKITVIAYILLVRPTYLFAQGPPPELKDPLPAIESLEDLVDKIAGWTLTIAIPLAGLFVIYAGFLFATSQGDEGKIRTARTTLWWTLIGVTVVIGARALAAAFVNFAQSS